MSVKFIASPHGLEGEGRQKASAQEKIKSARAALAFPDSYSPQPVYSQNLQGWGFLCFYNPFL